MFMSQVDAKHFLDDAGRAIIVHHPVAYDACDPVPKFEPPDFAKKYGKIPEGEYPDVAGMTHFAMMSAEAKRELLLSYANDLYEMLDEEVDPKRGYQADTEVSNELSLMVSWIVMTIDYALGMGETFRDVRRFYGRAPLHGCAPIDVPARRFPDTNQPEDLPHYPLGATSMRVALAQGGLYAEERAQARDPSPALDRAIVEGGAAVLAFPEAPTSDKVFDAEQVEHLNRFVNGGPRPVRPITGPVGVPVNNLHDLSGVLAEFGAVDAQYPKFR